MASSLAQPVFRRDEESPHTRPIRREILRPAGENAGLQDDAVVVQNGKIEIMERWLWLGLMLIVSSMLWAQQGSTPASQAPSSPAARSSSGNPDQSTSHAAGDGTGQTAGSNSTKTTPPPNAAPPRSDNAEPENQAGGESSSKESPVDLSPPPDDAKKHPNSGQAVAEAEARSNGEDINEMHTWNPHKAAKDVEVGDFYFRRKNYRAAEDRYREALRYKDNDAIATIRLAVCLEKQGRFDEALAQYQAYLKILPHGPEAAEAHKAIDRIKGQGSQAQ